MRFAALLLTLIGWAGVALAGDIVHLSSGRVLLGRVVSVDKDTVVVDVGGGEVSVPRRLVKLIERGGTQRAPAKVVTQRDEWFLVLHRCKLVGWRRLVHTESAGRVHVEERTVFFRPGGGDDVDIRRVEVADRDGRPVEFLLSETYGHRSDMVSGVVTDGKVLVRVRRDGDLKVSELDLPKGWTLALPAWSRFLGEARKKERRVITALDLRRLRPVQLVMTRGRDTDAGRTLRLAGDFRPSRAFYRPGEGSLTVELNGSTLVARRTTKERVAMARKAHAAPEPLGIDDAMIYPFHDLAARDRGRTAFQVQAGLALTAPDPGWIATVADRSRGLVLSFEKVSLFASLEAFCFTGGGDLDRCAQKALVRLRIAAPGLKPTGKHSDRTLAGHRARVIHLTGRHRGERLRCVALVVPAKTRYLLLLGASPERWWNWARRDFETFFKSLDLVP